MFDITDIYGDVKEGVSNAYAGAKELITKDIKETNARHAEESRKTDNENISLLRQQKESALLKIRELWDRWIGEKLKEVWGDIKDNVVEVAWDIKDKVWDIKDKALEIWGDVKDKTLEFWGDIKDKALEIWGDIKEKAIDQAENFIEYLKDKLWSYKAAEDYIDNADEEEKQMIQSIIKQTTK